MNVHYRVGGKQPRNIYRVTDEHPEGEYIGVFFDEADAAVAVAALNRAAQRLEHEAKWGQGVTTAAAEVTHGSDAM